MFFSENFITGLETKSERFQSEFYGIMEWFYKFFEHDEEKIKEFDNYIESQISYHNKGNLLYDIRFGIGGKIDAARKQEYFLKILEEFKELFLFPEDNGINIATNIIMTINIPESISADIIALIEMTIGTLKSDSTPEIKTYVKHDEDDCFDCYVAVMK